MRPRPILIVLVLAVLAATAWWLRPSGDSPRGVVPRTGPIAVGQPPTAPLVPATAEDAAAIIAAALPPAKPDAIPFRASPAQRLTDRERILRDADLLGLAGDLRARARTGDADAAAAMAELLAHCAMTHAFEQLSIHEPDLWEVFATVGFDAPVIGRAQAELTSARTRCAALALDPAGMEQLQLAWSLHAAALGDPLARLWRAYREPGDTPQRQAEVNVERQQAALELLAERGPRALSDHAVLLAGRGRYESAAFILASCQLIEACAADPAAWAVANFSLREVAGFGGHLFLRMASPRELAIAQGQAEEIVRLWRTGQFAQIVAPRERAPPGGG